MSLVLTAAPAVEPASLAEVKAHMRIDQIAEDAFIQSLIVTSRLHIEAALGLALIDQSWSWTIDAWPAGLAVGLPIDMQNGAIGLADQFIMRSRDAGVALPMRPVRTIDSIKLMAIDGTQSVLAPTRYVLDGTSHPARLLPRTMLLPVPAVPTQGIEINFTAGFGSLPGSVPAPIRHALLMLVAHWYENREPVLTGERAAAIRIPDTVSELLAPYRSVRL